MIWELKKMVSSEIKGDAKGKIRELYDSRVIDDEILETAVYEFIIEEAHDCYHDLRRGEHADERLDYLAFALAIPNAFTYLEKTLLSKTKVGDAEKLGENYDKNLHDKIKQRLLSDV